MAISRRRLLVGAASMTLCSTVASLARAQSGSRTPDPNTFESGDFLWPKKPGAFIPYRYESGQSAEEDRERWNIEKSKFLESVRRGEVENGQLIVNEIERLNYNDFRARYLRDQEFNQVTPYSGGRAAAVGHMAIIEVDANNEPWVIEALWEPGVVRQRYSTWINTRLGEIVWHGRLANVALDQRAKIAVEARGYVGRPYKFWNFNLADDSGFYCSKLAWLATVRALNIALDGNPNPSRGFWLSPKQLLYAKSMVRLLDPGEYAVD